MAKKNTINNSKIFGLTKKLLLLIIPLLVVSFAATAVVIFVSVGQTLLRNSKDSVKSSEFFA